MDPPPALSGFTIIRNFFLELWATIMCVCSFFYCDAVMYLKGKAYKPTHPGVMKTLIDTLQDILGQHGPYPVGDVGGWTFIDLGCGQGALLPAMRAARAAPPNDSQGLFERVCGVELDEDTYKEAVQIVNDSSIELCCGDMFKFVEETCDKGKGRTVFYMYEPLWKAGLSEKVVESLYEGLLSNVAKMGDCYIVYITGISSSLHKRHIAPRMFESHGMQLKYSAQVCNSGQANKITGTSNTLEVWHARRGLDIRAS